VIVARELLGAEELLEIAFRAFLQFEPIDSGN
jgi:hypothetical protein